MTNPDLEWLNCGAFKLDANLEIQGVNPVLAKWTQQNSRDLEGQDLGVLLTRSSMIYWETTVEALLENQGFAWDLSIEINSPKGPIAALVNARRANGQTECLLFPFSGRRDYERQVRAAEIHTHSQQNELARRQELIEFRRNFINTAAHELATPMTPLKIQFHVLKELLKNDARQEVLKAVEAMEANITILSKFTSALVASTEMEAGLIGLNIQPIELKPVIDAIVGRWRESHSERFHADVGSVVILADAVALQSCLTNLLENAVKFSPLGTPIKIQVSLGEMVTIAVHDRGRGIDPERLEELGHPFAQVHDTTEFTGLGAGLGLHVVKGLMHAQGGSLIIRSEGLGLGTTAELHFPQYVPPN
jgi:signal transduction histidine kinase